MIAHGAMAFNSPRAPKASPSSVPRILVIRESFDSRPAPDAHLKLSTMVRNDRRFFMYPFEKPRALLIQRLYTGIQPTETLLPEAVEEQLEPRVAGHYVGEGRLRHANHYVSRFTLRPISGAWTFNLVLLRAPLSHQPNLKAQLASFIGIRPNRIIPRIYQITGDYDYLLPVYTISDAARQDLEAELASYQPMTLQGTLNHDNPGDGLPLSPEQCATAEALFRNAGLYSHFHAEIQELREELRKNIWEKAPDTSDTADIPHSASEFYEYLRP